MPKIMTGDELKKMVADSLARRSTKFTSDVNAGLQRGAGGPVPETNFEENFTNLGLAPNRTTEGLGQMTSSYGTAIAKARPSVINPPPITGEPDLTNRAPGGTVGGTVVPPPTVGSRDTPGRGGPPGGGVGPSAQLKEIAATRSRIARTRGI